MNKPDRGGVGMTYNQGWAPLRTLIAAAVVLMAVSPVQAETPLSLSVAQSLRYDSNIMRDNNNKYRDAVSSTAVTVGLDKQYGRQTYKASLTGNVNKYKNTKELDHDGYDIEIGFTSTLASNWNFMLDHYSTKQLQSFEEQSRERYAESIVSRVTQGVLQYGLYARWSSSLTLGHSQANYETRNVYDKSSKYVRVGLRHSPTDLLYFDFGVRRTKADSPNYPLLDGSVLGDPLKRMDYELNSQWVITGYSRLNARVGWTQEKHSRDSLRDYNGLTGNLRWSYTPTGKTTYSVAIDRDTNNSGGSSRESYITDRVTGLPVVFQGLYTSQNRLTTELVLGVNHSTTAKISLNAGFTYRRYEEELRQLQDGIFGSASGSTSRNGEYRAFSLGANYQIHRAVKLGCALEKYDRTASLFSGEYDGEQVTCNASVKFD
jgi:hypothetical protein